MRITFLNQFCPPDPSATAQLLGSLAAHRDRAGDQVTVVASGGGYDRSAGGAESSGLGDRVRVRRVWTPRLGKASLLRRLLDYGCFFVGAFLRMAFLPRQDVIVVLTTPPMLLLLPLVHKLFHPSTRLVLWSMDCYPEVAIASGHLGQKGPVARLLRAANRFAFRRLAMVVCLDQAMADRLAESYAPSRRPLPFVVQANWEARARFPAASDARDQALIEELGLQGRTVVLYTGNAGIAHEFETFLAAARQLSDEPYTFVFTGGGGRRAQLAAAELPSLHLLEYQSPERLDALFASADALLVVLRPEFLGLVSPSKLHAGLACGLPVLYVGPAGSNVDSALATHGCGWSIRNGDADALVAALRELRQQGEGSTASEMGKRARQAFESDYSDDVALARFDELFARLRSSPGA